MTVFFGGDPREYCTVRFKAGLVYITHHIYYKVKATIIFGLRSRKKPWGITKRFFQQRERAVGNPLFSLDRIQKFTPLPMLLSILKMQNASFTVHASLSSP